MAGTREKAGGKGRKGHIENLTCCGRRSVFRCPFCLLPSAFSLVPLPLPAPLHEQINPAIGDRMEPEPFVEPQRGIEAFDVDAQRGLAGGRRLCLQSAQQRRPDAAAAGLGQQRDIGRCGSRRDGYSWPGSSASMSARSFGRPAARLLRRNVSRPKKVERCACPGLLRRDRTRPRPTRLR